MPYTNRITQITDYGFPVRYIEAIVNTTSVNVNSPVRTFRKISSGQKVDGWKQLLKAGKFAASPYRMDATRMVGMTFAPAGVSVSCDYAYHQPLAIKQSVIGYASTPVQDLNHRISDFDEANSTALTSLSRKVNGQISHMNAIASFLEIGDVIRQFGNPMKSIISLTNRHLNRLFLENRGVKAVKYTPKQWVRRMSDLYLEYAFGLAPLIKDTKAASEALARWHLEQDGSVRSFKKTLVARGETSDSDATDLQFGVFSHLALKGKREVNTWLRVQYVIGLEGFTAADIGSNKRLGQLLGFRPESWIPAVWEAVPWSWLVDYFTNVQDILQSLEASVIKPSWIVRTDTSVTEHHERLELDRAACKEVYLRSQWNDFTMNGDLVSEWLCRRTTLDRTLPASLGFPTVQYRLPSSVKQLANMAAALIVQKRSLPVIELEKKMQNFSKQNLSNQKD